MIKTPSLLKRGGGLLSYFVILTPDLIRGKDLILKSRGDPSGYALRMTKILNYQAH